MSASKLQHHVLLADALSACAAAVAWRSSQWGHLGSPLVWQTGHSTGNVQVLHAHKVVAHAVCSVMQGRSVHGL